MAYETTEDVQADWEITPREMMLGATGVTSDFVTPVQAAQSLERLGYEPDLLLPITNRQVPLSHALRTSAIIALCDQPRAMHVVRGNLREIDMLEGRMRQPVMFEMTEEMTVNALRKARASRYGI